MLRVTLVSIFHAAEIHFMTFALSTLKGGLSTLVENDDDGFNFLFVKTIQMPLLYHGLFTTTR